MKARRSAGLRHCKCTGRSSNTGFSVPMLKDTFNVKLNNLPLGLFVLTLCIFIFKLRWLGGGDCTPNELLPIALIHHHGFYFNEFVSMKEELPYYFLNIHGHIVSVFPIIPGL